MKTLALVSPFPPAATGVADFAARLAEGLAPFAHIKKIKKIDSADPAPLADADVRLYQIGNNRLHAAAYNAALRTPGAVELHDAVLHHFLLGRLTEQEYVEEFVLNYGEWMREEAVRLWEKRAGAEADEAFFRRPMLRRLVESAEKIIVHNPAAARMAREALPDAAAAEIVEIPHFVDRPEKISDEEIRDVRRRLGISAGDLVVGCFGYHRPTKRLGSVLEAMAMMRSPCRLMVVGDFVSVEYEQALAPRLAAAQAIRLPFVEPREFVRLAAVCDVCVNLRDPAAGETSGVALKLAAMGRPIIVTDCEENVRFPPAAVVRVDAGEAESEMLAAELDALARGPELRATIGRTAARYVAEQHGFPQVIKRYRRSLGL